MPLLSSPSRAPLPTVSCGTRLPASPASVPTLTRSPHENALTRCTGGPRGTFARQRPPAGASLARCYRQHVVNCHVTKVPCRTEEKWDVQKKIIKSRTIFRHFNSTFVALPFFFLSSMSAVLFYQSLLNTTLASQSKWPCCEPPVGGKCRDPLGAN